MAPTRRPRDGLLARVNFPLYAVEMLTSRHALVAGGGGSSKTGVANGFEIYEIYHNGVHFCAEEVVRYETGANVVMNFAVRNHGRKAILCAGQESHCQMYYVVPHITENESTEAPSVNINNKLSPTTTAQHGNGTRRRNTNNNNNNNNNTNVISAPQNLTNGSALPSSVELIDNSQLKRIHFEIKAADLIQTDFLTDEPLQRVVRISPNGMFMATGGTDGHLRVWTFPQLGQYFNLPAHRKEIDDIDFSPDSKSIVTISKDGQALVWDVGAKKQKQELTWTPQIEGTKYLYKRCRYATIEAQRDKYRLFTISNPLGKVGKQRGYLQQWDCVSGKLRLAAPIDESLASLAVRDDGRFVAVGSMFSGSISMYIAFSLQRVLHIPNAHSMFVTGLAFLPITNDEGPPISSDTEAAVLSISVDNKVCIHSLPYRKTMPIWIACIFIMTLMIAVFTLCAYINI